MHGLTFETSILCWQDQPGEIILYFIYKFLNNTDISLVLMHEHKVQRRKSIFFQKFQKKNFKLPDLMLKVVFFIDISLKKCLTR